MAGQNLNGQNLMHIRKILNASQNLETTLKAMEEKATFLLSGLAGSLTGQELCSKWAEDFYIGYVRYADFVETLVPSFH